MSETAAPTDRAEQLAADAARIPDAIRSAPGRDAVHGLRAADARAGRIVCTGLGSSRFAAISVAAAVSDAWRPVLVEHASTPSPTPVGPGDLVVAISSSGATPETVAAARRARGAGATVLAVTNVPGSPLAAGADGALVLGCEPEASGVATTTHAASVSAIAAILEVAGAPIDTRALREAAAAAAADVLASRDEWLADACDALDRADAVHLLAAAPALGAAEQAALLLREAPRLPADVTEAGDWLHVGLYTALPGYRALLLAGTAHDGEILDTIGRRGGAVVGIGATRAVGDARFAARIPLGRVGDGNGPAARLAEALAIATATTLLAAALWARSGPPRAIPR